MTAEHPSSRFDSLHQEAFLNLWRTYDRLKLVEESLFERFELSAQQYNALRLLRAVAPGSLPTLALGAKLVSRAPDMTRLIDKLETRGLVKRERRPENRRVVELAITAEGIRLLDSLDAPVRQCALDQLGHLDEATLRKLIQLLHAARSPHEDDHSAWQVKSGEPLKADG